MCHRLCGCLGDQVLGPAVDVTVMGVLFAGLMRVSCLWRWSNLHCWSFVRGGRS